MLMIDECFEMFLAFSYPGGHSLDAGQLAVLRRSFCYGAVAAVSVLGTLGTGEFKESQRDCLMKGFVNEVVEGLGLPKGFPDAGDL